MTRACSDTGAFWIGKEEEQLSIGGRDNEVRWQKVVILYMIMNNQKLIKIIKAALQKRASADYVYIYIVKTHVVLSPFYDAFEICIWKGNDTTQVGKAHMHW